MNKRDFIKEASRRTGISTYAIDEVYNITYELIVEKLIHNETIELPKIGCFSLTEKNAKGLLCGDQRNMERKCTYPLFKINESLKKRIKNRSTYQKIPEKL
ncbi:MAG: HU family DNA-binding protein [Lachnospiraceae bacterium]|nr:HU family DNA-binding protein [Lachnospiraceae bacterium]